MSLEKTLKLQVWWLSTIRLSVNKKYKAINEKQQKHKHE
jgi:hypothetical protein